MALYPLLRPLAFALDPERAHQATIEVLQRLPARRPASFPPSLTSNVAGLAFPSPVGLAAGFDKNAEVPVEMLGLGFGFVEVGTLTPRAQAGNDKPRMFRLVEDRAVINRLGFNNRGHADALPRVLAADRARGVIGVNIGANKDSQDRIADYVAGVRMFSRAARYLTINISSPNTPGLRQLQDEGALKTLLSAIAEARDTGSPPRSGGSTGSQSVVPPIFLKVAPDLGEHEPDQIVRVASDYGVDAIIVANTTVSRPPLRSRWRSESGGLSGAPLKPLALQAMRAFRAASGGEIPLIGVGGIASADDAWERIRAGASLVQLYSAMVYQGPGIARRIAIGLAERLNQEGMHNIAEAVGTE